MLKAEPASRTEKASARQNPHLVGLLLAVCSLFLNVFWAVSIKALYSPDEPAHLETVMEMRDKHILPEIHYTFNDSGFQVVDSPGNEAARNYALQLGFPDTYKVFPYESVQPPLYYMVAALVSEAVPSDPQAILLAGRIVSALFGAGTVFFCWAAVRALAPGRPWWAFASAGFVMLLPQFCFNTASVSNDSAINFAGALAFYVWFRGLRDPGFDPWLLKAGAVTGLAILAKLSALALLPGLGLLVLCRVTLAANPALQPRLKRAVLLGASSLAAALAVCGWWLVRNLIAYGEVTGTRSANRVYTQLLGTCNFAPPGSINKFVSTIYESTVGRFGWMDLVLPDVFYAITMYGLLLLSAVSAVAITAHMIRNPSMYGLYAMAVSILVGIAVVVGFIQYNMSVACQPQGRFFFMLLAPASAFLTFGMCAAIKYIPARAGAIGVLLLWLALLNIQGLLLVSSFP